MCVEICLRACSVWANAKERVIGLFWMAGLCQVQIDSGERVGEERKEGFLLRGNGLLFIIRETLRFCLYFQSN